MAIPRELADALIAVVRERMSEQGMTGVALAAESRMPQATISRKLRGIGDLTLDEIDAIAVALGEPGAEQLVEQARRQV